MTQEPPHVIPGRRAVAEALRSGRALRELIVQAGSDTGALEERAGAAGVPVRRVDRAGIDALAEGVAHQGVLATAPAFRYRNLDDVGGELVVLLDGITDPQNLGAIARSAEAAGAGAIVLPKRRSARVTPAVERAAAGALSWLGVALAPNATAALERLARRGFWSVGLEGSAARTVWDEPLLDGPVCLVVGAEGSGLSRLATERCDALVSIPLAGRVGSLNASAAAAVALFEVQRRRRA